MRSVVKAYKVWENELHAQKVLKKSYVLEMFFTSRTHFSVCIKNV
jgi:hypothetical protein